MANIAADTILARLRALLDTGVGGRSITSTRFDGDLQPSLPVGENVRRALVRPRYDVQIASLHPSSGSVNGTHHDIYQITVNVRVVRALTAIHVLDDATRDAAIAAASTDADDIAQCFTFEDNVTASTSGVVSGKLELQSSTQTTELSTDAPSHVTSEHVFTGWVCVALTAPAHPLMDPGNSTVTAWTYDSSTSLQIMRGSNTMTWSVVFYQETPAPIAYGSVAVLMRGAITAGAGNMHGIYTYNGSFYFGIFDGTGTWRVAPIPTLGSSFNGTMNTLCYTYDSPTLRTYVNGVQYGSGQTTNGGLSLVSDGAYGGDEKCLSINKDGLRAGGGNRNTSLWFMGVAVSDSIALSATQIAQWHAATVAANSVATFPSVQYLWTARANPTMAASWPGSVGSSALTRYVGTGGTVQTPTALTWAVP
jgi:hypothetical protein